MSLINDALKRAQERPAPPAPPLPTAPALSSSTPPPLDPAGGVPAPQPRSWWLIPVLLVLLLAMGAGAFLAFGALKRFAGTRIKEQAASSAAGPGMAAAKTRQPDLVARALTTIHSAEAAARNAEQGARNADLAGQPVAPDAKPSTADKGTLPGTGPATNVVASATAPVVPPPNFKLQGVVYHPTKASAMINGRVLFIGDRLNDYELVRVTVKSAELNGPQGPVNLELAD